MKKLIQKNCYYYEFKGHFYFRKRLSKNVIKNASKDMIFRKSILKICSDYKVIKNKKDIIFNLTNYLNEQLNFYIKIKGLISIEEITLYIQDLCEKYLKEAIVEYSELEDLRNNDIQIIDSDKITEGHTINAIAKEWLTINKITKNLSNENVVIQKAKKILTRSNITKEQILEIPENDKFNFYVILLKSEKQILENDMRLYISRNLNEFNNLIDSSSYSLEHKQKTEQILYKVLNLIMEYPNENDYIDLIKKQSKEYIPSSFDRSENFDNIKQQTIQESNKKENLSEKKDLLLLVDDLVNDYFRERNMYSHKSQKNLKYAIRFFKDYLIENKFNTDNIKDFDRKHMQNFTELFANLPVGNKAYKNETLYTLNKIRVKEKIDRMQISNMKSYATAFKSFWKDFSTDPQIKIGFDLHERFNVINKLKAFKQDDDEDTAEVSEFKVEDINGFINYAYSKDKLKIILRDSPYNFYSFIIGLLHGCRMNEIMALRFKENLKVYEKKNIRYFYFHLNENHKELSLKNPNAHRNIIIPKILIELGFLNYINKRYNRKETIFDFTYNKDSFACGRTRAYFGRKLKDYFKDKEEKRKQEAILNKIEYIKDSNSAKTQFRSLRKTFADKMLSQVYGKNDTELNKKRLIGHTENTESQRYVGRLEPSIAYEIINAFDWSEINFDEIKDTVKSYYHNINEEILYDLPWLNNHNEDWKIVTTFKVKKSKGIKNSADNF